MCDKSFCIQPKPPVDLNIQILNFRGKGAENARMKCDGLEKCGSYEVND